MKKEIREAESTRFMGITPVAISVQPVVKIHVISKTLKIMILALPPTETVLCSLNVEQYLSILK